MARAFSAQVSRKVFDRKVRRVHNAITKGTSPLAHSLRRHFSRHVKTEYLRILQREMPPARELDILNRGFVVRRGGEIFTLPAKAAQRKVGTGEGGRFIRASFTHVTQAVAKETPQVDAQFVGGLRVGAVNAERINEATSFRWSMRDQRGRFRAQGKTKPFGRQYIQVLETGGIIPAPLKGRLKGKGIKVTQGKGLSRQGGVWTWTVTHRKGKRLYPEEGVFVWQVEKTVVPIMMFRRALFRKGPIAVEKWIGDFNRHLIATIGFSAPKGSQLSLF